MLDFIQRQAGQDDREAYSTLNMGAGFALFVKAEDAERTAQISRDCGIDAWGGGAWRRARSSCSSNPGHPLRGDDLALR